MTCVCRKERSAYYAIKGTADDVKTSLTPNVSSSLSYRVGLLMSDRVFTEGLEFRSHSTLLQLERRYDADMRNTS